MSPQVTSTHMASPLILSVCAITLGIWMLRARRARSKLPPGPTGWPIIGNLFDIPTEHSWFKYTEWGEKYGPITYVNVGGLPMIIVNSHRIAYDLLAKRGAIYSDRPRAVMVQDLVGMSSLPIT